MTKVCSSQIHLCDSLILLTFVPLGVGGGEVGIFRLRLSFAFAKLDPRSA
jgi:hypothetical protein